MEVPGLLVEVKGEGGTSRAPGGPGVQVGTPQHRYTGGREKLEVRAQSVEG